MRNLVWKAYHPSHTKKRRQIMPTPTETFFSLLLLSFYFPLSTFYSLGLLDRPDLLAHENSVTDPKTEKGDGHNRNKMGDHDENALYKGKWVLESGQR